MFSELDIRQIDRLLRFHMREIMLKILIILVHIYGISGANLGVLTFLLAKLLLKHLFHDFIDVFFLSLLRA